MSYPFDVAADDLADFQFLLSTCTEIIIMNGFYVNQQVRDFKFMCPTDTVFDQENFICANWFEIDCRSSTLFYNKNLQLFQPGSSTASSSGGTSTTEEPSDQQRRQQEQQLKQLMVLEEQQAAQVFRQQQVLEQHEKRQQEHQVNKNITRRLCFFVVCREKHAEPCHYGENGPANNKIM